MFYTDKFQCTEAAPAGINRVLFFLPNEIVKYTWQRGQTSYNQYDEGWGCVSKLEAFTYWSPTALSPSFPFAFNLQTMPAGCDFKETQNNNLFNQTLTLTIPSDCVSRAFIERIRRNYMSCVFRAGNKWILPGRGRPGKVTLSTTISDAGMRKLTITASWNSEISAQYVDNVAAESIWANAIYFYESNITNDLKPALTRLGQAMIAANLLYGLPYGVPYELPDNAIPGGWWWKIPHTYIYKNYDAPCPGYVITSVPEWTGLNYNFAVIIVPVLPPAPPIIITLYSLDKTILSAPDPSSCVWFQF